MCAINGITEQNRELIVEMNEVTRHRGPDGSSIYSGKSITLGHNRLAIIDPSIASGQPMHSNDGRYVIVFNGEIYNFKDLKEELKSTYPFKTQGDTEVILAAYSIWGIEMLHRLRGIFAFALWDTETEELLLVRDHMGVKPLYYSIQDGICIFSSELPGILSGVKNKRLNETALSFYLAMEYVPSPQTLVLGVEKLGAGELLKFKNGTYTKHSYLKNEYGIQSVSESQVYSTIKTAVERQLISDRPVGAYLSGGFDSSIVVHHMASFTEKVRAYSVNFEAVKGQEGDSGKFNRDAELARETAQFFATEHKMLTITLQDVRDNLEKAIAHSSEPVANSTAITQYLLSDFVRKDGTIVVLGGDAGDELFGGYTRHRIAMGAYLYQKLPATIRKIAPLFGKRLKKLDTPFGTDLHMALMVKDEKKLHPSLSDRLNTNANIRDYFDPLYEKYKDEHLHPVDTFMRVDRATWLPDECFIRSDYASMAHGIELRVPLADLDVVSCADHISMWRKTLPHEGKRIIRETYKKHLPAHLYGQPKRGWLSPAAKWFRDPVIGDFAKGVFSSDYYDGLTQFDWKKVQEMLDAHINQRGYYLYPLWNILVLQVWAQHNKITS